MAEAAEILARLERLEGENQGGRFDDVGRAYGEDADSASLRSALLMLLGAAILLAGTARGVYDIASSDDGALAPGLAVGSLSLAASLPAWWSADRYRRSATENRRLQRHVQTVEPYLEGFSSDRRDEIQLHLAQRLFARDSEDNDPLTRPIWPLGPSSE